MTEQLDTQAQVNPKPVRSFADGLPGPSPLSAVAQIVEQAENSAAARPTAVEERLERFPELRGVQVPGGNTGAVNPLQAAQREATSEAEGETVHEAASRGFLNGFTGGLNAGAGAGRSGAAAGDRFERFPELREVTLAIGNAARFPELAPDKHDDGLEQAGQNGDYGR